MSDRPAQQLLHAMQQMALHRLNLGTSGNASVRLEDGFLVTPSGVPVDRLRADSMVSMTWDGVPEPGKTPSSEWRFHRDILQARPEIHAVVHAHSMFATTMACVGEPIPAFHYMISAIGGDDIPCAPYALFGSQALSEHAVAALTGRLGCLLAHHGMIALGRDLTHALAVAVELENLCEQYWRLRQLGPVKELSADQMREVHAQFKDYGQWRQASPE